MSFLLTLFFSITILPHDIDLANFSFSQQDNQLLLQIHLDKEDTKALFEQNVSKKSLSDSNLTTFMEDYLGKKMTMIIDDKKINFTPISLESDPQFYHFQFQATTNKVLDIHKIQLENTCFIYEFPDYNLLINFDVNEVYRTFRMHKERLKISFAYER